MKFLQVNGLVVGLVSAYVGFYFGMWSLSYFWLLVVGIWLLKGFFVCVAARFGIAGPKPMYTGRRRIETVAEFVESHRGESGRKTIPMVDPGTGKSLGPDVPCMTEEEVRERVTIAREEQKIWKNSSFEDRRRVLKAICRKILDRKYEIAKMSCIDSGKTMVEAFLGEILISCEKIRWTIVNGEKKLKRKYVPVPMLMLSKKAYVEWIPKGVIGVIIPNNYPFHGICSSIVAALFSGNSCVVKISEYVVYSLIKEYETIFHEALIECGYSSDLVQFIIGYGETGKALIDAPVDHVFLIGSPQTGKHVMRAASEHLTPCTLELGGKDPFIICDDVDVDYVVDYAVRSIFINLGQNCMASSRMIVSEKILDQFTEKVLDSIKPLRQGPQICKPHLTHEEVVDCGAITMDKQLPIIQELVDDAVKHGAKILAGGKPLKRNGQFYPPTVIANVTRDMRIFKEEIFGPVMLIIPFKSDEEAVELANDTEFGLSSTVFGKTKRAERIAHQIVAGTTSINDYGVFYMIQGLGFGGVKKSGYGKFNGADGLRAFCHQKSYITDRIPGLNPAVPKVIRYPTMPSSHVFIGNTIDTIYRESIWCRLGAVVRLLKTLLRYQNEQRTKQ